MFFASERAPFWQDFAEAFHQLAVFAPGQQALLEDPAVEQALQQVAERGWSKEAQESARWALSALSGHKPATDEVPVVHTDEEKHIMMSYAWEFQEMVTRVVEALKRRGYNVWFGKLHHRPVTALHLTVVGVNRPREDEGQRDRRDERSCRGSRGDSIRSLGALQGVGELPDGGSVRDAAA